MAEATLILLPGLDGSGVLFRPLLPHLPDTIRPVVVSYPREEPLGYAELLPRVLAALPDSSPFVILGESFSGPLSLMAAATRPAGLCGVILCATFVRNPVWGQPTWLKHLLFPTLLRSFPALARLKARLAGHSTAEVIALLHEAMDDLPPEVIGRRLREVFQVDATPELLACPVPLLYLRGDSDIVVPRHNLDMIAAAAPSLRVSRFACEHLVLQQQPALAAAAIAEFVRDTRASSCSEGG